MWANFLTWLGVDPRGFVALLRAMILMDLREQYFSQSTASKPHFAISPLFLVVGQCLTASVSASAFLFARADVFFFAFVNLCLSTLLIATTTIVEFSEIALNPTDLHVIGHRPVTPRTYAAARLANLLFYFVLMFLALNIFPVIVGAGLREAGWLYAPAYLAASLGSSLAIVAVLVFVLSLLDAERLRPLKFLLAWAQIAAVLVTFYGGQLMLRDGTARLLVFVAFPPPEIDYLPTAWLARFVERAAVRPDISLLLPFALFAVVGIGSAVFAALWLEYLCRRMQPVERAAGVAWPLSSRHLGGMHGYGASWLCRSSEERVGHWLAVTFLRRDGALAMRCLFAFQASVVAALVGVLSGQFGNPCRESELSRTMLPLLAFFALPLGAPGLVFNLTHCRDSAGGWLLRSAPVGRSFDLAWGACKAALAWVVTPLALLLGVIAWIAWGDPLTAFAHAALSWVLTWATLLASLWLVAPALPFSLPPARGVGLSLPPLPTAAIGITITTLAGLHAVASASVWYWVSVFAAILVAGWLLRRKAERRLAKLGGAA